MIANKNSAVSDKKIYFTNLHKIQIVNIENFNNKNYNSKINRYNYSFEFFTLIVLVHQRRVKDSDQIQKNYFSQISININ